MEFLNAKQLTELIKKSNIDFLDFGCSGGGSIEYAKRYLGGKNGIVIDIDKKKIDFATKAGHNAVLFNIEDLPNDKLVDFVILSHFLEHIRDPEIVELFIRKAINISRKFVYIQQPSFDGDSYLFSKGLKK